MEDRGWGAAPNMANMLRFIMLVMPGLIISQYSRKGTPKMAYQVYAQCYYSMFVMAGPTFSKYRVHQRSTSGTKYGYWGDNFSRSKTIPIGRGERDWPIRTLACHLNPIWLGILGLKLSLLDTVDSGNVTSFFYDGDKCFFRIVIHIMHTGMKPICVEKAVTTKPHQSSIRHHHQSIGS
jgi:hypothetical protein